MILNELERWTALGVEDSHFAVNNSLVGQALERVGNRVKRAGKVAVVA